MGTIELKINDRIIHQIYFRNVTDARMEHKYKRFEHDSADEYYYEMYTQEEELKTGHVQHIRPEGLLKLTKLILKDIIK